MSRVSLNMLAPGCVRYLQSCGEYIAPLEGQGPKETAFGQCQIDGVASVGGELTLFLPLELAQPSAGGGRQTWLHVCSLLLGEYRDCSLLFVDQEGQLVLTVFKPFTLPGVRRNLLLTLYQAYWQYNVRQFAGDINALGNCLDMDKVWSQALERNFTLSPYNLQHLDMLRTLVARPEPTFASPAAAAMLGLTLAACVTGPVTSEVSWEEGLPVCTYSDGSVALQAQVGAMAGEAMADPFWPEALGRFVGCCTELLADHSAFPSTPFYRWISWSDNFLQPTLVGTTAEILFTFSSRKEYGRHMSQGQKAALAEIFPHLMPDSHYTLDELSSQNFWKTYRLPAAWAEAWKARCSYLQGDDFPYGSQLIRVWYCTSCHKLHAESSVLGQNSVYSLERSLELLRSVMSGRAASVPCSCRAMLKPEALHCAVLASFLPGCWLDLQLMIGRAPDGRLLEAWGGVPLDLEKAGYKILPRDMRLLPGAPSSSVFLESMGRYESLTAPLFGEERLSWQTLALGTADEDAVSLGDGAFAFSLKPGGHLRGEGGWRKDRRGNIYRIYHLQREGGMPYLLPGAPPQETQDKKKKTVEADDQQVPWVVAVDWKRYISFLCNRLVEQGVVAPQWQLVRQDVVPRGMDEELTVRIILNGFSGGSADEQGFSKQVACLPMDIVETLDREVRLGRYATYACCVVARNVRSWGIQMSEALENWYDDSRDRGEEVSWQFVTDRDEICLLRAPVSGGDTGEAPTSPSELVYRGSLSNWLEAREGLERRLEYMVGRERASWHNCRCGLPVFVGAVLVAKSVMQTMLEDKVMLPEGADAAQESDLAVMPLERLQPEQARAVYALCCPYHHTLISRSFMSEQGVDQERLERCYLRDMDRINWELMTYRNDSGTVVALAGRFASSLICSAELLSGALLANGYKPEGQIVAWAYSTHLLLLLRPGHADISQARRFVEILKKNLPWGYNLGDIIDYSSSCSARDPRGHIRVISVHTISS